MRNKLLISSLKLRNFRWATTSRWLVGGLLLRTSCLSPASVGAAPTRRAAAAAPAPGQLRIIVNGQVFTTRLVENETTRTFLQLLPLTLRLNDLGGREKYGSLSARLPSQKETVRTTYQRGDLSYWRGGGLAVFYHQDGHQVRAGLVVLARLDSAATASFAAPGTVQATFETVAR